MQLTRSTALRPRQTRQCEHERSCDDHAPCHDAPRFIRRYLYGVARNLVRMARRLGPVEEPVDRGVAHDIVGELIRRESVDALYAAIREMPDCYRDVVILCDLEEKSYEDVARTLGRPVGTVRSRLHRARALLGARLKRLRPATEAFSR